MPTPLPDLHAPATDTHTVLELTVDNHPGTMSHICGLFARRAFNLDAILCLPVDDGTQSRVWLRVREDRRLPQVIKQLQKLEDVQEVRRHHADHEVFLRLEAIFSA